MKPAFATIMLQFCVQQRKLSDSQPALCVFYFLPPIWPNKQTNSQNKKQNKKKRKTKKQQT